MGGDWELESYVVGTVMGKTGPWAQRSSVPHWTNTSIQVPMFLRGRSKNAGTLISELQDQSQHHCYVGLQWAGLLQAVLGLQREMGCQGGRSGDWGGRCQSSVLPFFIEGLITVGPGDLILLGSGSLPCTETKFHWQHY